MSEPWWFMDNAGSPDGIFGCEEQPECHRAISPALVRQHRQWVCCIFRKEETTEGKAVTLQVGVNFFYKSTFFFLSRQYQSHLSTSFWLYFVLFCRFESSSHAISMSAYLREQRRELYSKSGELQGEEEIIKRNNGWLLNSWMGSTRWLEV